MRVAPSCPSDTRRGHRGRAGTRKAGAQMRTAARFSIGILLGVTALSVAACGKAGSSGTQAPASNAASGGCAPAAGDKLVVLTDDKHLQSVDNVIAAVNAKAATNPALLAALDKVSAALSPDKLIALNKATDIDHKTPKVAAEELVTSTKLTDGIQKTASGKLIVGAANFSESQSIAELYRVALVAAGYDVTTQTIGNRELYEPALEKGQVQAFPEYVGTLTEFLNKKVNGASATPLASGDLDKTVTALKGLGEKVGLVFGKPAEAADQNAFAVTKAFADKNGVKTLSDFATKCSGKDTVLGGPPECPQRPFCKLGLEQTYKIQFGQFKSLDSAGPQTKTALKTGTISIGLVLSSDAELAAG
jgi:osmoprotectant transport system substrate-binding protein